MSPQESRDSLAPRLRRMIYTLFAVYWILVATCLVFPRMVGESEGALSGATLLGIVFLVLLLIALAVSLSLAIFSLRHRAALAMPDIVMGLIPAVFSLLALLSLWQLG